ncbi:uncharacterized protein HD556DRAFT_1441262 [Suillus plorans]|uniref:Glucose-methanol-choline oxidoreductase N-terminal domain-containing protein n=1 Tax=Suillus plorans TaxID=116603 RepID=A0A9P7DKK3_9AGAM|nr:uncharacterized protein HD556DRAFT_1441262 [Suillus plorans]KAG1797105.1 hypothetical protein HD556DRAFT_1441262 [Suillus plorans]
MTTYNIGPSRHLNSRAPIVHCAHCVGGGSSVNFMDYTRSPASDFNDWGVDGWESKNLISLMKLEIYKVWIDRPTHVYDRTIKVSFETCNTYSVRHLVMFLLIEVKPPLSEGSAAVCGEVVGPVDLNTPDMIYTADDEKAIENFHRDNSMS